MVKVRPPNLPLTVGTLRAQIAGLPDDLLVCVEDGEGFEHAASPNVRNDVQVRVRRLATGPDPYTEGWQESLEPVVLIEAL